MRRRDSLTKTKVACLILFTATLLMGFSSTPPSVSPPEPQPGDCDDYNPQKNPYFGDLHIHTSFSLDAVQFDTQNDPNKAYEFAKGSPVGLPPYDIHGKATRTAQLDRPLDFAAVTDHSEFLAEASICFNKNSLRYFTPYCQIMRGSDDSKGTLKGLFAFLLGLGPAAVPGGNFKPSVCTLRPWQCKYRVKTAWHDIQEAAEKNYDRSSSCKFTTFVGYEWTGSPLANNQHRNVIFRNDNVINSPISYFEADLPSELWNELDKGCTNKKNGCEVLTIPHNSNMSGSTMFQPYTESGNPYTVKLAAQRQRMEPLVEIYQHKGASECINGNGALLGSEDELCNFEMLRSEVCRGTPDDDPNCAPLCSDLEVPVGGLNGMCVEPQDFVRGALRKGLEEQRRINVNPFKMGIIASTDTHNGTPGATDEMNFQGHAGKSDANVENRIGRASIAEDAPPVLQQMVDQINLANLAAFGPGGLAVVWAEQKSRDPIFNALQRKETYGTSGTRIIARFFGGWELPENLCDSSNLVDQAYRLGVPMGGDLPKNDSNNAPSFVVSALMDAGTTARPGTPLQRIQIIKGWEENGTTFEKVFDVAGNPNNGAGVNRDTCETYGQGASQLCEVWQDPEFKSAQAAFYYARVVENPSCRWSHQQCNAELTRQGLTCKDISADDALAACCDGSLPETIQERAWTSPIWYTPAQ